MLPTCEKACPSSYTRPYDEKKCNGCNSYSGKCNGDDTKAKAGCTEENNFCNPGCMTGWSGKYCKTSSSFLYYQSN